jgi:uncharacterized membrane protein
LNSHQRSSAVWIVIHSIRMKSLLLFFSFLIGFLAGLRALTPPAVLAWAIHLGWFTPGSSLSWVGSTLTVLILTALALAELVADKLPKTPNRTAPPGLIARIVTGGFCGLCIALSGNHGAIVGALLGSAGAIAGTFTGYKARTGAVKALRVPDLYVALTEDLICIGVSLFILSRV